MLDRVEKFAQSIKDSTEIKTDIVPLRLIEILANNESSEIGSLLVSVKTQKLNFDFTPVKVKTYEEAYDLVKSAVTREEKIYYSLVFIGKFNKVTEKCVDHLLKSLTC